MGQGPPDITSALDFEPTTGNLVHVLLLETRIHLTRTQSNTVRADAVAAGGMSNVSAAYAAVKSAMETIETGRGAWLDHYTTGMSSTETDLIRRGVVWQYVARGDIPSPPQP
jgi:hypothetical protein